ncbi:Calpain-like protease palB/cpr-8 [Ceratocystis fimbriata CBS 114723]|uniref:Calpain-like protease palB/cpr-8 n=1 Tax=Ceratocystis fimbriata CBS 114723 TaxID=1035309 RepID=A0A2C5WXQ5_9PEZI|nr:Calpain-like protease palB/cpr-8 [Ceratocystis fimbriata CBS 114723]
MSSCRQAQVYEELASQCNGAKALQHATIAAELYLKAVSEAQSAAERNRLRLKCQEMLTLAEALKSVSSKDGPALSTAMSTRSTAVGSSSRQLSARERAILTHASNLHGCKHPPWDQAPDDSAFRKEPSGMLFKDTTNFSLSTIQYENFDGWKRPMEIIRDKSGGDPQRHVSMIVNSDIDLAQDVTTDCSVVASLCSAVKNFKPGKDSLLNDMIYPFDKDSGVPAVSENGKYIFRFHFNGCPRQVVIDDRLPFSRSDKTLFVVDLKNPTSMWPALLEKAYLKVRGGYDFPGSNSCTDLWIMTGWIPEQVFLQKEDLNLDQIWNTLVSGFDSKAVIITLGTGRMSKSEEKALGLVAEHGYGVLQLDHVGNSRKLLVKNPWSTGPTWRCLQDTMSEITPQEQQTGTRSFWVTFEDVVQNFESMYLNWNPALFKFRQDHHFMWSVAPVEDMSDTIYKNPQYQMVASEKTSAWILLARHHRDEELQLARERSSSRSDSSLGYMSIVVVEDGKRIFKLPVSGSKGGDFVDSHQTLTKMTLDPGKKYTVVPLHDKLPLSSYSFTLSFFTMSPINVGTAPERRVYWQHKSSSWSRRTAGGNSSFPSYGINPQYQFTLKKATSLSLLLSSDAPNIPLHFDIVWTAPGERAQFPLPRRIVVADSQEYVRRSASADEVPVDAGTYNIVCSTFQPNQFTSFSLVVGSDEKIDLNIVPVTNAGKLPVSLPQLVLGEGTSRARIPIGSNHLSRANAMLHLVHDPQRPSKSSSSFRLSVVYGYGLSEDHVAVTGGGEFEEIKVSLSTTDFDIEPQRIVDTGLWVVVDRIGGRFSTEIVQIELFSDRLLAIGTWEIIE